MRVAGLGGSSRCVMVTSLSVVPKQVLITIASKNRCIGQTVVSKRPGDQESKVTETTPGPWYQDFYPLCERDDNSVSGKERYHPTPALHCAGNIAIA